MTTLEKTEGKLSDEALTKNASLINAAHRAIVSANKTQMEKAIEAGTILKACKDTVGHGGWSKWLHDNCREISEETARLYMRLAAPENAWKLEAEAKQNGNAVADLSVRGAAKLIRTERSEAQKAATRAEKARVREEQAANAASALIPKQLGRMRVDDVLRLLTKAFDDDFLDTLVEALRKHLKEEEPKPPTAPQIVAAAGAGAAGSTLRRV